MQLPHELVRAITAANVFKVACVVWGTVPYPKAGETARCWRSKAWIMETAGVSGQAVKEASAWLVKHGFVRRDRVSARHYDWFLLVLPKSFTDQNDEVPRGSKSTTAHGPRVVDRPPQRYSIDTRSGSESTTHIGDRRGQEGTEGADPPAQPTEPSAVDPPAQPAHSDRKPDPSHWAEAIGERLREYAGTLDEPARSMVFGCRLNLRDPQARANLARAIDDCGGGWEGCQRVVDVLALRWDAVAEGKLEPKLAACTFGGNGKAWDVARERWAQREAAEQVRRRDAEERASPPVRAPPVVLDPEEKRRLRKQLRMDRE